MYTYWFILVCSVLVECLAKSWPAWLIAKLLAGIGVGGVQSTVPTYISEIAPNRIRGGLLMLYSFWWTVGSFFAQVALRTMAKNNPTKYLNPIYTQWGQIGLMLLIYIPLPESPPWCVSRGQVDRARKELAKIYRGIKNYNVEQHVQILVLAAEHEKAVAIEQRREHWHAIFRGTDGKRTIVSLWTNLTQQFIGLSLFGSFGTYFFQQAGLADPFTIKTITSSIQIATVIVVVFLADRVGRRWLACLGTTISWLSCIAIGVIGVVPQVKSTVYVFVVFACFWSKYLLVHIHIKNATKVPIF